MLPKIFLPILLTAGVGGPLVVHQGPGFMQGMVARHLGLSQDQQAALGRTLQARAPFFRAAALTFHSAHSAALEAGLDPATTPEQLRDLQVGVSEAGWTLLKEVRAGYLEVLPQLTEAQRAAGRAHLQQIRETFRQGHGDHAALAFRILAFRLDLTEAQRVSLQGVIGHHRPELERRHQALAQAREAMVEAALDPRTTESVLLEHHQVVTEAVLALLGEVRSTYLEALPQLTETQRLQGLKMVRDARTHLEGLRKVVLGF